MYNHCSLAPLEAFDLDDNDRKQPRIFVECSASGSEGPWRDVQP